MATKPPNNKAVEIDQALLTHIKKHYTLDTETVPAYTELWNWSKREIYDMMYVLFDEISRRDDEGI